MKKKKASVVDKEGTKMKNGVTRKIGVVIAATFGVFVIATGVFMNTVGTYYYVRIDNTKIRNNDSSGGVITLQGSMDYLYTLPAYNEKGAEKEITFGTSRKLREGAFLRLTVSPIRGVVEWSEVQYEELSVGVREKIVG